ncbi:MAG: tetratricopeptide repeat protein [Microcoleaceae cyanobacterium]
MAVDPALPALEEKLADALRERAMADLSEAMGYYQQLIQENPDHVTLYHKALAIEPNNPLLYHQLADVLNRHHQPDAALVFRQMARQLVLEQGGID